MTTVVAPGASEGPVSFVVLADGRVVVGAGDPAVAALAADRLALPPAYRAEAIAREDGLWVVGARSIQTVHLDRDPGGSEIVVVWDGVERVVTRDGSPTLMGVEELERIGSTRSRSYVVTARRLDGAIWEVDVASL